MQFDLDKLALRVGKLTLRVWELEDADSPVGPQPAAAANGDQVAAAGTPLSAEAETPDLGLTREIFAGDGRDVDRVRG